MDNQKKKADTDASKRILKVATSGNINIDKLTPEQTLRYNLVMEYMKSSTLVQVDADIIIANAMKTERYVLTGKNDDTKI